MQCVVYVCLVVSDGIFGGRGECNVLSMFV